MKAMTVGKLKANFSEILKEVRNGETVGILYGQRREPVAMIVPYSNEKGQNGKSEFLAEKLS